MRNVVISFTVVFCLLLTILSCCSVSFLSEVPITESKAVENAVSISLSKNIDKDITDEELMADFMNYYLKETANKGSSDIRFHQVDAENGLLDVEVIKTYYWMGVKKEVNTRKVAYIEKVKKDKTVDISDGDSYIGTTEFATLKITINGQVGYCLQENLSHPSKNGTKYYLADEVVTDENLIKIGYLTTIKSYKTTSVQYAIWSVVENDNYVECARSIFGDEVADMTAKILNDAKDVNLAEWNIYTRFFEADVDGYQELMMFSVTKVEIIPEPQPEPKEETPSVPEEVLPAGPEAPTAPQTGDTMNITLLIAIVIVSAVIGSACLFIKKRHFE